MFYFIKKNQRIEVDFQEYVKNARVILGLTQPAFALIVGVQFKTVQSWEYGKRNPSKSAQMIIEALIKEKEKNKQ